MIIGLSLVAILWYGWLLFNIGSDTNKLYNIFINEQVGTDDRLQNKVTELEKSESKECGYVVFFFIKNTGLVEFNLLEYK